MSDHGKLANGVNFKDKYVYIRPGNVCRITDTGQRDEVIELIIFFHELGFFDIFVIRGI